MDISELHDLIAGYEYGQFNILDNGMKISFNPKARKLMFDPLYQYDSLPTRGSCSELMNTAYLGILENFPEYHVTRVVGNDPDFFRGLQSKHWFLFLSESDLMNGKNFTYQPNDIEEAVANNPLVVDPSFHKVVPFSDSGYRVQGLFNQGCRIEYSNTGVLFHRQAVPLGVSSQSDMVYLIANLDSPNLMDIGMHGPGEDILRLGVHSPALDFLISDSRISRFVELLREREKSESRQEFNVERNIVIG